MSNGSGHYPRGGWGKHTYPPPQWRFDEMLFGLGSSRSIAQKLVERGYPRLPLSSIAGWRMRNSVPVFWLPALVQLALDEKIINRIDDLRVVGKRPTENDHDNQRRRTA